MAIISTITIDKELHIKLGEYADALDWTRHELTCFVFRELFKQIKPADIRRAVNEIAAEQSRELVTG